MSRRRTTALLRPFVEVLEGRWVPTTLTPTTFLDGGLGSGSLRDAVLQFNADTGTDDDIIQLEAGTYTLTIPNVGGRHETAGLTGDLNLTQTSHRWIIEGAGTSTIIDASQLQDRVFQIVNPGTQVVFQDLVIQGGLAQDNGADGVQAGRTDALGGGIFNNGGNLTLNNVVVQNNVARGGDVGIPRANGYSANGGGLYSTGGALTIAGADIANNQATGGRGGNAGTSASPGGNGGPAGGGGLYASGGFLDISDSRIANNQARGGRGGDGHSGGRSDTTHAVGGNGGTGQGGGLYVNGGSVTVASATIASNLGIGGSAGDYALEGGGGEGGGLYNGGTLTVAGSTLSDNSATGGPEGNGTGGGIDNNGTLTVSNSTLSGNSANGSIDYYSTGGGGILNDAFATLTVSNSTLSGNSALQGGGIYSQGTLTVSNSTLSGNRGTYGGGGLYLYPSSPVLHNTLIAGNFLGRNDVSGRLDASGDNNLVGDGTGMSGLSNGVNGNLVGSADNPIDPLLAPLDDNGGPTLTHALLPGSPAIDAGNNAYATDWDQRGPGYPRVVNGIIDIGAFEVQAPAASRPTGQPLPDPVAVQSVGTVGGPLLGQPPGLPTDPSPSPEPSNPDAQTVQPAPVPTATGQQAPATLVGTYPGAGQPLASLDSLSASDLDALALNLLGGP
jgi:predicted outer membrane repeat protein